MKKRDDSARYCRDCVYYGGWFRSTRCCNYILYEDKSRGCDPGKDCTKKVKRKDTKKMKWSKNNGQERIP